MRRSSFWLLLAGGTLVFPSVSWGAFVSGSTGADGPFNPTANTTLTLPASGVFNFTTVNIPSGVTVTFTKNAANTPVVILATGDVTIAGIINVSGTSALTNSSVPGTGGPGGFDGGEGGIPAGAGGAGLGPGGGGPGLFTSGQTQSACGGGGGFSSNGSGGSSYGNQAPTVNLGAGGAAYGTPQLIPLIGGSGGGGASGAASASGGGGGGGGGAILIASSGKIVITAYIYANGGNGVSIGGLDGGGGGSGGAIRLIANTIQLSGGVYTNNGSPAGYGGGGGKGRIRIEADTVLGYGPTGTYVSYASPGAVFLSSTPSLKITSVAGLAAPAQPTGSYATPDITLPATTTNSVTVDLAGTNIPVGTIVTVVVTPQNGAASTVNSAPLSGSQTSSTATASVTLSTTEPNVIGAYTTFTVTQTAKAFDGEAIEKVRVAANYGGTSTATYITASGREVSGDQVAWLPAGW